jgi:hypothetical protein
MSAIRKMLSIPLLLAIACMASGCNNSRILPNTLVGFWTTENPRYPDRFIELDNVYLFIGLGPRQVPKLQVVDKFKAVQAGNETTYTIYSKDMQGVGDQMTFKFSPANGGEIVFNNQRGVVWRRFPGQNGLVKQ